MIDPQVPPDQRANLTPEDLRDYYLEMGFREMALLRENMKLRQRIEELEAKGGTAAGGDTP